MVMRMSRCNYYVVVESYISNVKSLSIIVDTSLSAFNSTAINTIIYL